MSNCSVCLVLLVWCLLYWHGTGHRGQPDKSVTFEQLTPSCSNEVTSNPKPDLGVAVRRSFHSDIRASKELTRHHSGHTHRQGHHDNTDRDEVLAEPVLDELFDRILLRERRQCSEGKNINHQNLQTSLHKRAKCKLLKSIYSQLHSNQIVMTGEFKDALAHAENSTEVPTKPPPNELTWVVRERDGRVYESDPLEVDKVVNLYSDPNLPHTYKKLKLGLPPDDEDSFAGAPRESRPTSYFISRVFGKIVVPKQILSIEPYSSIGAVKQPGGYCTGTFIGPKHVLTAAHCLFKEGNWKPHPNFLLAKDCDPDRGVLYEWEKAIVPLEWMNSRNHQYDYGLVVVKSETPEHTAMDFGWKDIYLPRDSKAKVFQIGYPIYDKDLCMWRDYCNMNTENMESPFFQHNCNVFHGDSGSPIFSPFTEDPVVRCIDSHWKMLPEVKSNCVNIKRKIFASLAHWIHSYD